MDGGEGVRALRLPPAVQGPEARLPGVVVPADDHLGRAVSIQVGGLHAVPLGPTVPHRPARSAPELPQTPPGLFPAGLQRNDGACSIVHDDLREAIAIEVSGNGADGPRTDRPHAAQLQRGTRARDGHRSSGRPQPQQRLRRPVAIGVPAPYRLKVGARNAPQLGRLSRVPPQCHDLGLVRLARARASATLPARFLLVAHAIDNLPRGVGGPQDPEVLVSPDAVVADLAAAAVADLEIERAERIGRAVVTEAGEATAIDCLVRATRSTNE